MGGFFLIKLTIKLTFDDPKIPATFEVHRCRAKGMSSMEVDGEKKGEKKDGVVLKKIKIDDNPENEGAFMKLSAHRFRLTR